MKKTLSIIMSVVLSLSMLFSYSASVSAASESNATFVPFRSDLVKYLAVHSSDKGRKVQDQWLRLFDEELNYSEGLWANKYYGEYIDGEGTHSTKGMQATYNPELDKYLANTIKTNPTFIDYWIKNDVTSFEGYILDYESHPIIIEAITEVTSDGYLLGSGMDQANNEFEYSYPSREDLNILAVLSYNWTPIIEGSDICLSEKQKEWCKTYLPYLVSDYESNGEAAIASKSKNPSLYDLMAHSYQGYLSSKAQEFFNYVIDAKDSEGFNIGNIGVYLTNVIEGQGSSLREDITQDASAIALVFLAADADCDYTDTSLGDGDLDWLAYEIALANNPLFNKVMTLIAENHTASEDMSDWLARYYLKTAKAEEEGITIVPPFKPGQVSRIGNIYCTYHGCNKSAHAVSGGTVGGFYCGGHSGSGGGTITVPQGVEYITFGNVIKGNISVTGASWKLTNATRGTEIASGTGTGRVKVPTAYIWSSDTILFSLSVSLRVPGMGKVGEGSCDSGSGYLGVTGTYVVYNDCEINGHGYTYKYTFSEDNSTCEVEGWCKYSANHNIKGIPKVRTIISEDDDFYIYTAKFGGGIAQKTKKVVKKTGDIVYNAASSYVTGTTYNTKNCHGIGNMGTSVHYFAAVAQCGLSSGAIDLGTNRVSVNAYCNNLTVLLMNRNGICLDEVGQTAAFPCNLSVSINLSDYSDTDLKGCYLVINMSSMDEVYSYPNQKFFASTSCYLNSIVVSY